MGRAKILALAGATALLSTATFAALSTATLAADLPPPPPPLMPPPVYRAPVVETGGWYLRGDVGIGIQRFETFDHFQTNPAFVWPASWRIDQQDIKSPAFIDFGIGYAWNNWLRFDFIGEYRAKVPLKVLGSYTEFCPSGRCFDLYDINHSAWVTMVNAYLDLGTWWCLTPFVGAGVGAAFHTFHSATDIGFITGPGTTGFGFASVDHFSKWNFAWALHAGLSYNVTSNFKVEFAYRYMNFGSPQTSIINCSGTGCAGTGPRAYYTLTNFDSHDLKLGMRWMLQPEPPPPAFPPPVMRKG